MASFVAHGVRFDSEFDLAGFAADGEHGGRSCELTREARDPARVDGPPLRVWRDGTGTAYMSVAPAVGGGVALDVPGIGRFAIAADGRSVDCRPSPGRDDGSWKRFLLAQALPMVAVLQGLEVLHGSAVAFGSHAVVLSGASGIGKSTLALRLAAAGGQYLADDVAAVEPDGQKVMVHAASSLAFTGPEPPPIGSPCPGYGEPAYTLPRTGPSAVPLAALYLLEDGGPVGQAEVEWLPEPNPVMLLGTAFSLALGDAARRRRQLYSYSEIDAHARVFRVRVPRGDPSGTAALLQRHAVDLANS